MSNRAEHLRMFKQRWAGMKAASATHPYAQWITVIDPSTAPECLALHERMWRVGSVALQEVIDAHFDTDIESCRCRIKPMTISRVKAADKQPED